MTPSHRRSRSTAVVTLFAAASLLVLGCGAKENAPPAESPAAAPAATPAASPATSAPVQSAPAADPAATAPATTLPAPGVAPATDAVTSTGSVVPGSNVFVQEHETGVEVTLVEVKRTPGDSVTVKWRYRNTQPGDVRISKGNSSWVDPYRLTMDAFLIDPVNKKKYLVITDAEKQPLTSKHGDWQGVTLTPGQTLSSWAKFPAPPPDVATITVTIPGVPPFEDVPVVK